MFTELSGACNELVFGGSVLAFFMGRALFLGFVFWLVAIRVTELVEFVQEEPVEV